MIVNKRGRQETDPDRLSYFPAPRHWTHLLLRVRGATGGGGRVDDVRLRVENVAARVHDALVAAVLAAGSVDDGGDVAAVVDEVVLVEEQVEVPSSQPYSIV